MDDQGKMYLSCYYYWLSAFAGYCSIQDEHDVSETSVYSVKDDGDEDGNDGWCDCEVNADSRILLVGSRRYYREMMIAAGQKKPNSERRKVRII